MSPAIFSGRKATIGVAVLASMAATFWAGYHFGHKAGLRDKGPQHRALVVVRRTPGSPNSSGSSATWFDISDPRDAVKLAREEERLKAAGVEYYVAKGRIETTLSPEPDPRRVNSHR
jgi:hypothetical protein